MDHNTQLLKETGLAALEIAEKYIEWSDIKGEEENRNLYRAAARINLDLARRCGFPVGLSCDGNLLIIIKNKQTP